MNFKFIRNEFTKDYSVTAFVLFILCIVISFYTNKIKNENIELKKDITVLHKINSDLITDSIITAKTIDLILK